MKRPAWALGVNSGLFEQGILALIYPDHAKEGRASALAKHVPLALYTFALWRRS